MDGTKLTLGPRVGSMGHEAGRVPATLDPLAAHHGMSWGDHKGTMSWHGVTARGWGRARNVSGACPSVIGDLERWTTG